jgi:hypothetical protein
MWFVTCSEEWKWIYLPASSSGEFWDNLGDSNTSNTGQYHNAPGVGKKNPEKSVVMRVSTKFGSEAWKWYEGLVHEEAYAVLQTPTDNFNNYIKNVIFGKHRPVYLPPQRPTDFPHHRSHRRDICILNHDKISPHSALSGEYNPLIST